MLSGLKGENMACRTLSSRINELWKAGHIMGLQETVIMQSKMICSDRLSIRFNILTFIAED
jgi:hypothetical protein